MYNRRFDTLQLSSVQSLSRVQLFAALWTVAQQASLSIINFQSLLKLMSIESVMPSNHFFLYLPLLLLPSIFRSIRVFSSESALCIRWPKYWSFSFSISSSNEFSGGCKQIPSRWGLDDGSAAKGRVISVKVVNTSVCRCVPDPAGP